MIPYPHDSTAVSNSKNFLKISKNITPICIFLSIPMAYAQIQVLNISDSMAMDPNFARDHALPLVSNSS